MLQEVKKIEPISFAKVLGVLQLILGVPMAILFVLSTRGDDYLPDGLSGGDQGLLSVYALILFPILNGLIGFVGGWIIAFLYNFVANRIGGIRLEMNA